jgi:isochorismate hydrolase
MVNFKNENRYSFERVSGLVLDMQSRLLNGIAEKDDLVDAVSIFCKAMNLFEIRTIITEQVPSKLGETCGEISSLCSDSPKFSKKTFSAFGESSFASWVEQEKIEHLIITGIETPICVYLSAVDAIKKGMEVTVLTDCIGARRRGDAAQCLGQLESIGCHLLPLETLLYSLLGSADHAVFRSISEIVRARTTLS